MRRHALDLALILVGATVFFGYLMLSEPKWRAILVHLFVVFLGMLALFALLSTATESAPGVSRSPFDAALSDGRRQEKPLPDVAKTEREVALATASAYDLHARLLPHLREIAQCRLERTGRAPGPDTLGRWWELLRPDRPVPEDRFAPGIKQADLRALVSDLERL